MTEHYSAQALFPAEFPTGKIPPPPVPKPRRAHIEPAPRVCWRCSTVQDSAVAGGEALPGTEAIFRAYGPRLRHVKKEHFLALLLDGQNRVMREVEISVGCLNASLVVPRDALVEAVRDSAAGILFVHNHPSGSRRPSPEDHSVTRRLKAACELLGIALVDHVIVAEEGCTSFAEDGWL